MTDKLPPLQTPFAPPNQTSPASFLPPAAAAVRDDLPRPEPVEEEPYTIKCVCNYPDDDGNTIFCESCETWQHIECYYPDKVEDVSAADFPHSCVDCDPRSIDSQQAHERQRARIAGPLAAEPSDKKPKRPPTKSHKKKPKPTDLQINGHGHHSLEHATKHPAPHDNRQPSKKTKGSHKSSQSISAPGPKRSPSYGNAKAAHSHPLSPATTPPDLPDDFEIHTYSQTFQLLCNEQPSVRNVKVNSFAGLSVSNTMTSWLRNPEKMKKETGLSGKDVFSKLPDNASSLRGKVEVQQTRKNVAPGTVLQWHDLRATSTIEKDSLLMEVNGHIGFQTEYCAELENRWDDLTTPLPFVLFHPLLPLYIDTRREGSEARFVRRSCRPNAALDTFLSDEGEYHFWLVSERDIAPREQITIAWDFRFPTAQKARMLRILGLGDEVTGAQSEVAADEEEYLKLANWVSIVLSEFGGCACDLGPECAFALFHRKHLNKTQPKKTKKRKPKAQHAISPSSTGHATNSRAPSEGHLDDAPEHEHRSISGSSRSKPPSRDMTPTARQGSFDTLGILTEPTDRDKRKVAMVEDSFRRMEQQQPPRKKKRVSDGTAAPHSRASKAKLTAQTPNVSNGLSDRLYADAGTGTSVRSKSGSPTSPHTIPPHGRHTKKAASRKGSVAAAPPRPVPTADPPVYVDAAVQTDPERETATPQRRVGCALRKRALDNRRQLRAEEEERRKRRAIDHAGSVSGADASPGQGLSLSSPISSKGPDSSPATVVSSKDVAMTDAPSTTKPVVSPLSMASMKHKSPDLRVQMPPVPAFGSPVSGSLSAGTPLSAGGSVMQSPFSVNGFPSPFGPPSVNGIAPAPSPVKKKMSLSDYKRRINEGRPSAATSLRPPSMTTEEPKSAPAEGSAPSTSAVTGSATTSTTAPKTGGNDNQSTGSVAPSSTAKD
ncbi:SET domain-containing protein 3 [Podospora pseudoanserina]|uniref:SET domain-containing protein 3 n=1 Tax=Podospora pseudoanserina TaxID=2609844 RepID=A0ABR0ICU4_9PEZI|nr:SET domain-containing protein 3 [Podospora pseudoanserina]